MKECHGTKICPCEEVYKQIIYSVPFGNKLSYQIHYMLIYIKNPYEVQI